MNLAIQPCNAVHHAPLCITWTLPCSWSHYFHHSCSGKPGDVSIPSSVILLSLSHHRCISHSASRPLCSLPPPLILQSCGEVKNWLNICLSVGNEPTNVASWACSIFIRKLAPLLRLLSAQRHICSPSKSQTERKMSCECKSISCLFQVFISPSLRLSLHLPFSLYLLPLWRSFSSLFNCTHSTILLCHDCSGLFSFNQTICHSPALRYNALSFHPQQERAGFYGIVSEAKMPKPLSSWQRGQSPWKRKWVSFREGLKV